MSKQSIFIFFLYVFSISNVLFAEAGLPVNNIYLRVKPARLENSELFRKLLERSKMVPEYSKLIENYTRFRRQLKSPDIEKNSVSDFSAVIQLPKKDQIKYLFRIELNRDIKFNSFYKACSRFLKGNSKTQCRIKKEGADSIILTTEKARLFLKLIKSRTILGTEKAVYIDELKTVFTKHIKLDSDILIEFSVPLWLKKEVLKNREKMLHHKKYLKTDLTFLNGLQKTVVKAKLNQKLELDAEFKFNDKASVNSFKSFIKQYLPLIKFELMTMTQGKIKNSINSIKIEYKPEKRTVYVSSESTSEDLSILLFDEKVKDDK